MSNKTQLNNERKGLVKRFAGTKTGKVVIGGTLAITLMGGGAVGASALLVTYNSANADALIQKAMKIKDSLTELTTEYNGLRADRDHYYGNAKESEAIISQLNKDIKNLEAEIVELESKAGELTPETKAEINSLKAQVSTLTAEKQSLQSDIDSLNEQLNEANSDISKANAELDKANTQYQNFKREQETYYENEPSTYDQYYKKQYGKGEPRRD